MIEHPHLKLVSADGETGPAPGVSAAAQFAAPEMPQSQAPAAITPEEEVELARLRAMRIDDLVMEYLGNRDRLDEERHAFQRTENEIKGRLSTMSMVMREKADELGVDAFPIRGVGTAYRNQKVSYRVVDWTPFAEWVAETKNFQCLEKRVAKLATAEIEKSTGSPPPGIDKAVEVEFLVRRNKA